MASVAGSLKEAVVSSNLLLLATAPDSRWLYSIVDLPGRYSGDWFCLLGDGFKCGG